jgi:hypothetical protein
MRCKAGSEHQHGTCHVQGGASRYTSTHLCGQHGSSYRLHLQLGAGNTLIIGPQAISLFCSYPWSALTPASICAPQATNRLSTSTSGGQSSLHYSKDLACMALTATQPPPQQWHGSAIGITGDGGKTGLVESSNHSNAAQQSGVGFDIRPPSGLIFDKGKQGQGPQHQQSLLHSATQHESASSPFQSLIAAGGLAKTTVANSTGLHGQRRQGMLQFLMPDRDNMGITNSSSGGARHLSSPSHTQASITHHATATHH